MHTPKIFEQSDHEALMHFIADYPLASLICELDARMEAHHIPLYLVESNDRQRLRGHIARANKLWDTQAKLPEVLVIFQGPQAYISPNWYPSKKIDGKAVPTWNYTAVHVRGEISFIHDREWKLDMLNALSEKAERHEERPWKVSEAPKDYIEKQLNAIVGLEIAVSSIAATWKLSQNQNEENRQGVLAGLEKSVAYSQKALADFMRSNM